MRSPGTEKAAVSFSMIKNASASLAILMMPRRYSSWSERSLKIMAGNICLYSESLMKRASYQYTDYLVSLAAEQTEIRSSILLLQISRHCQTVIMCFLIIRLYMALLVLPKRSIPIMG